MIEMAVHPPGPWIGIMDTQRGRRWAYTHIHDMGAWVREVLNETYRPVIHPEGLRVEVPTTQDQGRLPEAVVITSREDWEEFVRRLRAHEFDPLMDEARRNVGRIW